MPNEDTMCQYCGLLIPPHVFHGEPQACITALRKVLMRQRELAQHMAYDISTRFLAILEELSLRPDAGIGYKVRDPRDPEKAMNIPANNVAGVFGAIMKKFHEACDWSPSAVLREENRKLQEEIAKLRADRQPDTSGSESPQH